MFSLVFGGDSPKEVVLFLVYYFDKVGAFKRPFLFFFDWSIVDFYGFLHSSVSKDSAYNAGVLGLIPGLRRSPVE